PAGNYAVVIGAGAFGATGQFAQLGYGNAAIPNISFVGGNRFGWFERASTDIRVVVEGFMTNDLDGDGVDAEFDNCAEVANADQTDTDGDGIGNACDADLNNDCTVNVVDLGILRSVFFEADADADFNGDGVVNVIALGNLRSRFFSPPGPSGRQTICDFPVELDSQLVWRGTFSYDFDTGIERGSLDMGTDFFFDRQTATESYFRPLSGASIGLIGPEEPSVLDCAQAAMSPERLPLASVNLDDWLCARTNDGRLSRLQITGANVPAINEAALLEFTLTTFACDDCEVAYDPTPLSNLIGWFDGDSAASFTTENGALVAWADRSGNLEPITPPSVAQQPAITATGINGIGSVVFDGTDDRLCTNTPVSLQPGYSVFVVAQNDVRMDYNGLLSLRDPSVAGQASFELYWQVGTTDAAGGNLVAVANREIGQLSGLRLLNPPPAVTQTYLASAGLASSDPGSAFLRVNANPASPLVIGTPATPVNSHELCVGHGFGPLVTGNTLNGSIGEVLIFDRRLSILEILFVETYLTQKWF
ncbi:MAG: thrombospondin type 3 repeat-containing protein, partial [Gammaproteobacteria bacterium]